MSPEQALFQELQKTVLEYLTREQQRAEVSTRGFSEGTLEFYVNEARAHEINNITMVISEIFKRKEDEIK